MYQKTPKTKLFFKALTCAVLNSAQRITIYIKPTLPKLTATNSVCLTMDIFENGLYLGNNEKNIKLEAWKPY